MVLATVGDLLEDVVVFGAPLSTPTESGDRHALLNLGADTNITIERRRGGSAATVAATVARSGGASRFIGKVGDDRLGRQLVEEMVDDGVEMMVNRGGRTGSIVVLIHADGERSMLTDRGAAVSLDEARQEWLDGVGLLHVPLYSLVEGSLAASTSTLIRWAGEREIPVSIDVSATSVVERFGPEALWTLLARLRPAFILANRDEAAQLDRGGDRRELATEAFVEKRGGDPARVSVGSIQTEVPALRIGAIADSTGAGDAFAAGFGLARLSGADVIECTRAGHRLAAAHVSGREAGS